MGRNHARYNSRRFADPGSDRRVPALGVQLRLGLWSVWTRRGYFDRGADSGAHRARIEAATEATSF